MTLQDSPPPEIEESSGFSSRKALPSPLLAVLFDLDGTIADTHGLIFRCYDHAFGVHLNKPGIFTIWQERVGLPLDDILVATLDHYQEPDDLDRIEAIKQTYRAHMWNQIDTVKPFEGIIEVIEGLKAAGVKLAIVTTKHRKMALAHLEQLQLMDYFDEVVAGDDCENCKPHPEPFLKALAALQIPESCSVAIGDSRQDILGARAAGIFAIGALWGADNLDALYESSPDRLARAPADLYLLFGA